MVKEINTIKFFCTVALLIFGRTRRESNPPYTPKEACEAIDVIAEHTKLSDDDF